MNFAYQTISPPPLSSHHVIFMLRPPLHVSECHHLAYSPNLAYVIYEPYYNYFQEGGGGVLSIYNFNIFDYFERGVWVVQILGFFLNYSFIDTN